MTTHEFAHKVQPMWRALVDIERIALAIHVGGDTNAKSLQIAQIARDTRSHFTAEEQEITDMLVQEIRSKQDAMA